MYITATLLFIFGMVAGGAYGYFYTKTISDFFLAFGLGGFLGSAAGALVFTLFYFTAEDDAPQDEHSEPSIAPPILPQLPPAGEPLPPLVEKKRLKLPGIWKKSLQKTTKEETSKAKIKRLKKELKTLKKQKNNGRQP